MRYYILVIIMLCLATAETSALRITEIMYNPACADDTALEWVELYNDSQATVTMTNWTLNGKSFTATLAPNETLIIARKLTALSSGDSFEKYYGNNSGVWGDSPPEQCKAIQLAISLANTGTNTLTLADNTGATVTSSMYTPADGGNGNDKTIEVYSDGTRRESSQAMGSPCIVCFFMTLTVSPECVKNISVKQNNTVISEQSAFTQPDFRCYGLYNGSYDIAVTATGYSDTAYSCVIDNNDAVITMELTPIPLYMLTGSVVCESIDRTASVVLYQNGDMLRQFETGGDGAFSFASLQSGTYDLSVQKYGYEPYVRSITVTSDLSITIELVRLPVTKTTICIENDAGIALADADIIVTDTAANLVIFSGKAGVVPLDLINGNYSITAEAGGHFRRNINFSVPYDTQTVMVRLVRHSMLIINEIDFCGDCEYVELLNRSTIPVETDGLSIADGSKTVALPSGITIADYCVLTGNRTAYTAVYGTSGTIIEISGMPVLNNDIDTLSLLAINTVLESVSYTASFLNGIDTSLDRLRPDKPLSAENLYPALLRTPCKPNSTAGLVNDDTRLKITEVAPFGGNEYIEIVVSDDGNSGNGALLKEFWVTDLDTEEPLAMIKKTGDVFLITSLSLSDDADQALLMKNGVAVDGMGWRKKTNTPSESETEDFTSPTFNGLPLIWYETADTTLSFQRLNDTWELRSATPGSITIPAETVFSVPQISDRNAQILSIAYNAGTVTKAVLTVYDIAGIKRFSVETIVSGIGTWQIDHTLETGRFIYILSLQSGERKNQKKGTFILR